MGNNKPTIAFMGTPEFAVPVLRGLVEAGYPVVGAFSQPDRPKGRGHKLAPTPVKLAAQELGVPVYQFERIRRPEGLAALADLAPELVVTAAFGQILSQRLLDIPTRGCLNVHASLLPAHRGAAPVQWSLIQGDRETGVTIMRMDAGVDTGDILCAQSTPIAPEDDAQSLLERLARMGAELLPQAIEGYLSGALTPRPQEHERATHEPMLTKADGRIDWSASCRAICDRVRGTVPWPGAHTLYQGEMLKVWQAAPAPGTGEPGVVLESDKRLVVAAGEGAVELLRVQSPGTKNLAAADYLRGHPIERGARLGAEL